MHLCYIDESGTPDLPGNTSHFILAGLVIPIWHWRNADREIRNIKYRFGLQDAEIHTAWILRKYREQKQIENFDGLGPEERRAKVLRFRHAHILELQRSNNNRAYRQTRKNYKQTAQYIHLTFEERCDFVESVAECVSNWGFARLIAECVDKIHFDPQKTPLCVDEQAFEQVVSRFERFLQNTSLRQDQASFGLIVHDNNETVAKKHTDLMRKFHRQGTFWIDIERIIETPLYVDSQLTSMVQIADLCAYALRRYFENNETWLFDRVYRRADRHGQAGPTVGIRHFTDDECQCTVCADH